ncbi:MAG: hypothetical protein M1608_08470 [Candidatus Omnitrophica bacterium]|nr:hypothetical protein [Candidatus Omnitrophota bacterium]
MRSFAHAQLPPPSSDVTQSASILQRNPHDRVWQVINSGTDAEGNPMVWTNIFTELLSDTNRTLMGVKMGNNLFYRGTVLLADYIGTLPRSVYNNEFDGVNMNGSSVLPDTTGYNGFVNTLSLGGPSNVYLTNFIYASAALGD